MLVTHAIGEVVAWSCLGAAGGMIMDAAVSSEVGLGSLLSTGAAGAVIVAIIVLTRAQAEQNKNSRELLESATKAFAESAKETAKVFAETTQTMSREAREAHETCTNLLLEVVKGANKQ